MRILNFLCFLFILVVCGATYHLLEQSQQATHAFVRLGQHQDEKIFEADMRSPMATIKIIEAFTR